MALMYIQPRRVPVPRMRRGFRGLGDCAPFAGDIYSGVQYCRDNATGSLIPCTDAACNPASSGPSPQNMPTFIPAGSAKFATMPFGMSTTTTYTLASYMAQKVQEFTAQSPLSLQNQGITPSTAAAQLMALAQQYCAVEGPPDCGQINSIVAAAAAQVAGAYANIPASQWNPATFTAYAPSGPSPGAASSPGGPGGGGPQPNVITSPGPSIPVSVVMKNLTRTGSDTSYQVGDQWQITIQGNPGAAVTGSASQNGKDLGTSAFGNLNGSGQMILTGAMTAAQIGAWSEGWTVKGNPSVSVSFSVAAAGAGSNAGAASGATTGGGTSTTQATTAPGGFTLPDLSSIPIWAWLAGGGVLLFMFMKK